MTGTKITLATGTRVGIDSGEKFEWGGTRYDWYVVGEGDGELLEGVTFRIESKGVSHATMNGGGHDYQLRCTATDAKAIVRTTFVRPESATFKAVA